VSLAYAIQTNQLSKTYKIRRNKYIHALNEVTLEIQEGKIFALLGLNGAGKTTFIKTVLGLVKPTSGSAFIFGESSNAHSWKLQVGYLPELFQGPKYFTAFTFLKYMGELSRLSHRTLYDRINEILSLVGLQDADRQKIHTFSKGMTQRLGIAQALLHKPRLLIMDEPSEGLDPLGRKIIRNLLNELRNEGTSIFLNSHLLSEVELIADEIAIMNKGEIVAQGSLEKMLPQNQHFEVELLTKPEFDITYETKQRGSVWVIEVQGTEQLKQLLSFLELKSFPVNAVRISRTSLEDLFFSYIPKGQND